MLSIADATVYRPMWSQDVLEELTRNLTEAGIAEGALRRLVDQMRQAFEDAEVTGYQHRIDAMSCHPKDRHVLAAAVHGRADTLVTFNLRDFPRESVNAHGLRVQAPDDFLLDLIDLEPSLVIRALGRQSARHKREPKTLPGLLAALERSGVPAFAEQTRRLLHDG